ncbi:hypothetical protein B0H63DRAFT_506759 [Podospora didyma]|uniref:Uncharacterized protein n=1 Tax=Podospora didyma TaxID=330526 RepID=A0AAE0U986_9PEZI|nr:hypothetical protein B0H63DRAFT_506759 [Podospora didyma]
MAGNTSAFLWLMLLLKATWAQQLNQWDQTIFGIGGSPGHWGDNMVDKDPSTFAEVAFTPGQGYQFALLLNFARQYQGLYIQSSGDFITDYYVNAQRYQLGFPIVGRVCGATSNFTLVTFTSPEGSPFIYTDSLFITVKATLGTTAIINEVYPIYAGDTIFYPNNSLPVTNLTAPCPGEPTPTTPPTPSSTPAFTPTYTFPPGPTQTIPGHPNATLNRWKDGLNSNGVSILPIILANPSEDSPSPEPAMTDYNFSTYFTQETATFTFLFNDDLAYEGLYIQSLPDDYITAISVDGGWPVDWTIGRVSGATSEWTVVRFVDKQGNPAAVTTGAFYFRIDGTLNGRIQIVDIYPIYAGDMIADL